MAMQTPEQLAKTAAEWRVAHEDEFFYMAREALSEARRRGWASIHNAADRTRMERSVRIPNVIKPALARMLVAEVPELGKYMRLNRASIDEVDVMAAYRERKSRDEA